MNRFPESTTKATSARRKLLRATMSAPVLLTVYSGSAMAGASTRCLANAQTPPTTGTVITAANPAAAQSTDAFVRVRLYQQGGSNYYWVKGFDLGSKVSITGGPTSSQWRKFAIGSNEFTDLAVDSPTGNPQLSDKYAAVRYDAAGTVVGVGGSGGGSAITQSCWQSFPSP